MGTFSASNLVLSSSMEFLPRMGLVLRRMLDALAYNSPSLDSAFTFASFPGEDCLDLISPAVGRHSERPAVTSVSS